MRVLVTGATGFVGTPLVAYLAAQGHEVISVVRKLGDKPAGSKDLRIVPDITSADWEGMLGDIDVIVHIAARVHQMKDKSADPLEEFRAVNRDATMTLAKAGLAQGVKRFVFLSSVKAAVDATTPEGVDEEVDLLPTTTYGRSKLEAEIGLIMLGRQSKLEVVILRPPLIYGPGVKANFQKLVKIVKMRVPLPLGGIDNRRSLLGLNNLLSAINLAVTSPNVVGDAFFLADDQPVSTPALLQAIGIAAKRRVILIDVPMRIMREFAELFHQRDKVERLADSLVVNSAKFRAATGWTTEPMAAELERLVAAPYSKQAPVKKAAKAKPVKPAMPKPVPKTDKEKI